MLTSKSLKTLIKKYEGLHDGDKKTPHLQPQKDPVGIWTIGWGHAIKYKGRLLKGEVDKKIAYNLFPALTLEQAELLLEQDLAYYIKIVNTTVKSIITQNQKDALTSFVYNVGGANFSSSTLLKKVNSNPSDPSITEEFKKWKFSQGQLLNGLLIRRIDEAKLYFTN